MLVRGLIVAAWVFAAIVTYMLALIALYWAAVFAAAGASRGWAPKVYRHLSVPAEDRSRRLVAEYRAGRVAQHALCPSCHGSVTMPHLPGCAITHEASGALMHRYPGKPAPTQVLPVDTSSDRLASGGW